MLDAVLAERRKILSTIIPFWADLSPARQEVLLTIAINNGLNRLLTFRRLLLSASEGNVQEVCREMDEIFHGNADELIEKYRRG